jgi:hypothetical protein
MDATSKQVLDAFGEAVIREVYDRSCKYLFDVISRGMKGNEPDPLHLAYQSLDPATAKLLRQFLFEAVDQTFAQFLAFIDNHNVSIPILTTGGDTMDVASLSDGLAAEPYDESGWIARFSKFKDGIPEPA